MNNMICKIIVLLTIIVLSFHTAKSQPLPLLQGDAVITHSPNKYTNGGVLTTPGIVVRIVHTNNTLTAPLGTNWNTSAMIPIGQKPVNDFYPNWNTSTLGNVFGITLDQNSAPNIYVSSTQIYHGSVSYDRKIWRLDGSSGANTLVYNFNNSSKSLGNLKYAKIGGKENIYVSDWGDGVIRRVTGNSALSVPWSQQSSFNPKFGNLQDDPNEMPYGLAIRNMSGGGHRLYYAKVSTITNNLSGSYGGNQVFSVGLDTFGDFVVNSETLESISISMNKPPTSWTPSAGTWGGNSFPYVFPVIADIAFTEDGKQMLIGQQSWGQFGVMAPHNSGVYEFKRDGNNTQWIPTGDDFPSGQATTGYHNCTGGVTYSNNILQKGSSDLGCDTTVWFTSDYIHTIPSAVYGIQGMNANGGSTNSLVNSIWIDEDDDLNYYDKLCLGDVEVYKIPQNCIACGCGYWGTINGQVMTPPIVITFSPPAFPLHFNCGGSYSFAAGNVSGNLNATYTCNGTCQSTISWKLNNSSNVQTMTGTTVPVNLSQFNNLPSGSYTLILNPVCGADTCPPCLFYLNIVDNPPPCCPQQTQITITPQIPTYNSSANLNGWGTYSQSFTVNSNMPMSEIRMDVEHVELTSSNPDCIRCINLPKTWGTLLGASYNGNVFIKPINSTPFMTGLIFANGRDLIYNPGYLITFPGNIDVNIALPNAPNIECCHLFIGICLKFTFKDKDCRECIYYYCNDKIELIKSLIGNQNGMELPHFNKDVYKTEF